jgi:myo-inositol-1-phosphate synthase
LEPALLSQLKDELEAMHPLPSAFDKSFVAPNQEARADNVLTGSKSEVLATIRKQMRDFKTENGLDQVIILWSANTERYSTLTSLSNIDHPEVSPSMLFAMAAIEEGFPYINGSPQNTFTPAIIEMAIERNVPIMGDDFKTGQTKFKTVIVDFLISSGLKCTAVTSYNHLGNNDGFNKSHDPCFESKKISKSSVIDDMVERNPILYSGDSPSHVVVIKYVKAVGDSKRALDEYDSDIFCGGKNTIACHNTCEDSLLAAPLMIDLIILMELFTRIEIKKGDGEFTKFHPVMSALSFLLKAPLAKPGCPVINSLFQQRACLENILRACRGLQPLNHMHLEWKTH